ncbi:MAG: hypothetical protein WKG32_00440 [Gemmatimonadaceae bacterium]
MAKRRVAGRGRGLVAIVLVTFVLISVAVVWRRTAGIARARELRELSQRRTVLVAERERLTAEILEASSRGHLAPLAERKLNMHLPRDSGYVILTRPVARR